MVGQEDTQVVEDIKTELNTPKKYKVIFINDDITAMEFVLYLLESVFHKARDNAIKIMMDVHTKGSAIVGVYVFEIAESKVCESIEMARLHGYPLMVTSEVE